MREGAALRVNAEPEFCREGGMLRVSRRSSAAGERRCRARTEVVTQRAEFACAPNQRALQKRSMRGMVGGYRVPARLCAVLGRGGGIAGRSSGKCVLQQ